MTTTFTAIECPFPGLTARVKRVAKPGQVSVSVEALKGDEVVATADHTATLWAAVRALTA